MKQILQLITSLTCFVLCGVPVKAAVKYWDINGTTAGAGGATPAGTWDIATANWTTDAAGASAGTTWVAGDDAIFSAGTDGAGAFEVSVSNTETAGNVTVEEGTVIINGGTLSVDVAAKGVFNIAPGLTATVGSVLAGGANNQTLTKQGSGTLMLTNANTYTGLTLVSTGIVATAHSLALGATNAVLRTDGTGGAAIYLSGGIVVGDQLGLAGAGVTNGIPWDGVSLLAFLYTTNQCGALRNTSGSNTWSGAITVNPSARITCDTGTLNIAGGISVASTRTVTFSGAGDIIVSSVISKANSGTEPNVEKKLGAGKLTLSGNNTYGGLTKIMDGNLSIATINDAGVNGVLGNASTPVELGSSGLAGILQLTGTAASYSSTRPFTMIAGGTGVFQIDNSGTTLTLSGVINGTGTLKKTGLGRLTLSNTGNTNFSGTVINAGTVVWNANAALGGTSGSPGTGGLVTLSDAGTGGSAVSLLSSQAGTLPNNILVANLGGSSGTVTIGNDTGNVSVTYSGSVTLDRPATLKGGGATGTCTFTGGISGAGGVTITANAAGGRVRFNTAANTYLGGTTVSTGGTLLVNNTTAGAVTVDGTLGGTGTISGPVVVNAGGVLAPGASVGTLTLSSDLTLSGNLFIEVNKSLSPSNDIVNVTGTLTNAGTGTVTVTNLGAALVVGDSFQLFNKAVLNGAALTVVSAGDVVWTNKLAVDGSIAVLSAAVSKVAATNLTIAAAGPASFNLGGAGAANSAYNVYASTNVAMPMTNWWLIGTTNSSAGGVIQFLDSQATNQQRFYRFGQ